MAAAQREGFGTRCDDGGGCRAHDGRVANAPLRMPCSRSGGVAGRAACCTAEAPTDGRPARSVTWLKWKNPSAPPEKPGYLPERATDRGAAHPAAGRLQAATVRKRCGM